MAILEYVEEDCALHYIRRSYVLSKYNQIVLVEQMGQPWLEVPIAGRGTYIILHSDDGSSAVAGVRETARCSHSDPRHGRAGEQTIRKKRTACL